MSLVLINSDNQNIWQQAPFSALPFTIGLWFYPTTMAATNILSWFDSVAANDYAIGLTTTGLLIWGGSTVTNFGTVAVRTWNYLVFRGIAAANKRAVVLPASGVPVHVQSTNATALTATNLYIASDQGIGSFFDGYIARFFLADIDVQADGTQLSNTTLYQLAYKGPFSIPHLASRVVEYEAWDTPIGGTQGSSFYARYPQKTWTFGTTSLIVPSIGAEPPVMFGTFRPPNKYAPIAQRPT